MTTNNTEMVIRYNVIASCESQGWFDQFVSQWSTYEDAEASIPPFGYYQYRIEREVCYR